MDMKKLMLILGSIFVALVCSLAVRSMLTGRPAPAVLAAVPKPSGPRVLVALRALPVGTIVTPDAVAFQPWPRDMVQDAYFLESATDRSKLIGTVVRNPVTAGQPLTQGALVAPGDRGFLAAALGPGMRAVTIPVSDMSGVAGFIFPGDHVDMMLTQTVKAAGGGADPAGAEGLPLNTTETVLRNLRVLAIDQTTETEVTPAGKTVARTAHAVTVEVTPRIAEKIAVAQTLGSLSLSLRALADSQDELDHALAGGTPRNPAHGPAAPARTDGERPEAGGDTFSTGGDVSRFARRALPGRAGRIVPRGALPPAGPTVRVARGNSMTAVPFGIPTGMQPLQPALAGGE